MHRPKIVVLGRMFGDAVAGVVWQALHYMVALERLGFETYYIEWRSTWVPHPSDPTVDAESPRVMVADVLRQYGFEGRWICRADFIGKGCTFGDLPLSALPSLYAEAVAVINLTASHTLEGDQLRCPLRVYLETDPGTPQVQLDAGDAEMWALVRAHTHHFTFGENLYGADCLLPRPPLAYMPTRQPVLLDWWQAPIAPHQETFTTIGKWKRRRPQIVHLNGETYHWSKDLEFARFLDLPRRTSQRVELALSKIPQDEVSALQQHGWHVADATHISSSLEKYRHYVQSSRGEFTVAKDLNIRTRSGWFSDRSACYLASGKPVINQDTGFDKILPTGEGLFSFRTMDDVLAAFDAINTDYEKHSRAALEIAREYFDAGKVVGELLDRIGVSAPGPRRRTDSSAGPRPAMVGGPDQPAQAELEATEVSHPSVLAGSRPTAMGSAEAGPSERG